MIRVVLPGVLRQDADGATTLDVDLSEGATLEMLLDDVGSRYPALNRRIRDEQGQVRRFVNVFVDGVDVRATDGLRSVVAPDAEVLILPSVAGG